MNTHVKIVLPQETETPVAFRQDGVFYSRHAYARSADSAKNQDKGQDFLNFWVSDSRIVFALCDGVSQSFYGDVAARLLGNQLLETLKTLDLTNDETTLANSFSQMLQRLTTVASNEVNQIKLPPDISPLIAGVLEKKRQIGSESTFVAGAIDIRQGYACFIWMGDSRLRLFTNGQEITNQLGETFHTQERWSTRKGQVGNLHLHRMPVTALNHLVAYSDGFSYLDKALKARAQRPFSDRALQQFILDSAKMPASDDISFLEIWLHNAPRFPQQEPIAPPFLQAGNIQRDNKQIQIRWEQIPNATAYEIRFLTQNGSTLAQIKTADLTWESNELDAQTQTVEIRSWDEDEPGNWSNPVDLQSTGIMPILIQPPLQTSVIPIPVFEPPPSSKPTPAGFPASTPQQQPQKTPPAHTAQRTPPPTTQVPVHQQAQPLPPHKNWLIWLSGSIVLVLLFCVSATWFTITTLRAQSTITPGAVMPTKTVRSIKTAAPMIASTAAISATLTATPTITPTATITVTATDSISPTPVMIFSVTPVPTITMQPEPTQPILSTPSPMIPISPNLIPTSKPATNATPYKIYIPFASQNSLREFQNLLANFPNPLSAINAATDQTSE